MAKRAAVTAAARQRILEAALDEIALAGESLTLQGVAERADLALRTLYNHFPSRDTLLSAAFGYHFEQTRAAVEAVSVPDAAPDEQLRHVVGAYYSRYATMGQRLGALLSLRGFPELDEEIQAIRGWRRQVLHRIVQRARRVGVLAMPERMALALVFTMTSYASWEILVRELHGDTAKAAKVGADALCATLFHATAVRIPVNPYGRSD
jgi:AcrR family transcriptional regulator